MLKNDDRSSMMSVLNPERMITFAPPEDDAASQVSEANSQEEEA